MAKVWHLNAKARFKEVGSNTIFILFAMHTDKYCVEVGKPLCFDIHLLVPKPYEGWIKLKDMQFEKLEMWIQLYQLPLGKMTRHYGEQIGKSLGGVLDVDVDENDIGWGQSL